MSLYFIAVVPQQKIAEKAKQFSKDFADRFNSVKSYQNFPHITVIKPFHLEDIEEHSLVRKFSEMTIKSRPFDLKLKGFGCFANRTNPVIFIKPENKDELQKLYDEVQQQLNFHPISEFHPHLTVAYRDLTFENFKKAWEEYEKKTFEDSFLVDKICLFKHDSKKWNFLSIKNLE